MDYALAVTVPSGGSIYSLINNTVKGVINKFFIVSQLTADMEEEEEEIEQCSCPLAEVAKRYDCTHSEYKEGECDYCQAAPKIAKSDLCETCMVLCNSYKMVCCRQPAMLYEVATCDDLLESKPSATWIISAGDAYCLNCVPCEYENEF